MICRGVARAQSVNLLRLELETLWLLAIRSDQLRNKSCDLTHSANRPNAVAADMIIELIRFEPGVCVRTDNYLEFKVDSVSGMRISANIATDLYL